MDTRKVSQMGLLIALALVLSYIEAQIPAFVAIPGIKIGLANIVVVFALYRLGIKEAVTISFLRVLLASLMFGSVLSLAYSFAGAFLSLLGMVLLKKTNLNRMYRFGHQCNRLLFAISYPKRYNSWRCHWIAVLLDSESTRLC